MNEEKIESFFTCLDDHLKNIANFYANHPTPGLITPANALFMAFADLRAAINRAKNGEFFEENEVENEK